ncbi:hypothetical protein RQP46_009085 [Phenoliferia psychrophenolica]
MSHALPDLSLGGSRSGVPAAFSAAGPSSPWSFPLTPSLFANFESNPFEYSFNPENTNSLSPSKTAAVDDWLVGTPGGSIAGVAGGGVRRKRAYSSPAVTPGGLGGMGFDFNIPGLSPFNFKQPRLSLDAASPASKSLTTAASTISGFGTEWSPNPTSIETTPTAAPSISSDFSGVNPTGFADPFHVSESSILESILAATTQAPPPTSFSTSSTILDSLSPLPLDYLLPFAPAAPTPAPHTAYENFLFAPPTSNGGAINPTAGTTASAFLAQLDRERSTLGLAPLTPSALDSTSNQLEAESPKGRKEVPVSRGAKGRKGRKESSEPEDPENDDEEGGDEDKKRKEALERNRLAARKSRQKKRERVGNLEFQAGDLSARNHALQAEALALREEVMQLRQHLSEHNGCTCQHVAAYLARERAGGGIPTINHLARHTLGLDYTNAPRMGSEDDLYADLDMESLGATASTHSDIGTVPRTRRASTVAAATPLKDVVPPTSTAPVLTSNFAVSLRKKISDNAFNAGLDLPVGPSIALRPRATAVS